MKDLIKLLNDIRPSYSDVGSRDVDTTATNKKITEAITLLEALAASTISMQEAWLTVGGNPEVQIDRHGLINCLTTIRLLDEREAAEEDAAAQGPDRREKEATQLANIHIHIADYHYAMDTRQHGGDAARTAFAAICGELDVYWKQGEEAQRRKVKV